MKITTVLTVLAAVLLVQAAPVPSTPSSSTLVFRRNHVQASANSLAASAGPVETLKKRHGHGRDADTDSNDNGEGADTDSNDNGE
ncbi:hypothetical protein BGZ97_000835, partial [Linnemannia gamsii]